MRERLAKVKEAGMESGALPITVWGGAIVVFAACGAIFAGLDVVPSLLSAAAGLGAALWGLFTVTHGRRSTREAVQEEPEVVLDISVPTVIVVFGFTVAMGGLAAAGPGFFWPGVCVLVLGLLALIRESRDRRAVEAHAREVLGRPPAGSASVIPQEEVR